MIIVQKYFFQFIEEKDDLNRKKEKHLPQSLTIKDKEDIVLNYIDKEDSNLNYLRLIRHARNKDNFKLSDKIRLKAKRKEKTETNKILKKKRMWFSKNMVFQ